MEKMKDKILDELDALELELAHLTTLLKTVDSVVNEFEDCPEKDKHYYELESKTAALVTCGGLLEDSILSRLTAIWNTIKNHLVKGVA